MDGDDSDNHGLPLATGYLLCSVIGNYDPLLDAGLDSPYLADSDKGELTSIRMPVLAGGVSCDETQLAKLLSLLRSYFYLIYHRGQGGPSATSRLREDKRGMT